MQEGIDMNKAESKKPLYEIPNNEIEVLKYKLEKNDPDVKNYDLEISGDRLKIIVKGKTRKEKIYYIEVDKIMELLDNLE